MPPSLAKKYQISIPMRRDFDSLQFKAGRNTLTTCRPHAITDELS
jgi:hypothetical protein